MGAADDRGDAPAVVVGVGASAGGIDALRQLFSAVSAGVDAAWIVVLHRDQARPSALGPLLEEVSGLEVIEAAEGERLAPGRVHVVPAGRIARVRDGAFALAEGGQRPPTSIDELLTSLAADQQERAIGVVLSGTGTDGANGLRAIRAAGGLAIVQDPNTAVHDGMPRAAQRIGAVDLTLAPDAIPDAVAAWLSRTQGDHPEDVGLRSRIVQALLRVTGHDFSGYKEATFRRRITRRMGVLRIGSIAAYAERVDADDAEVQCLMEDLLIGVTRFFRDPGVWDAVAECVVGPLVHERDASRAVRIWVPGCSSGEEAYTLAILVLEAMEREKVRAPLQIFGTDIDRAALEQARRGVYGRGLAESVSPERLSRWFVETRDGYQVADRVRDVCLFSAHDLLRDPPFSRLDLVSCRNVLIYLGSAHQERVLLTMHYALRPGGVLLLGPSEDIDRAELFRAVDRPHRVYRRLEAENVPLPSFHSRPVVPTASGSEPTARPAGYRGEVETALIASFTPPAVAVDDRGRALYFHGRTGRFLEPPEGSPTSELVQMARSGLRAELRSALHRARQAGGEVVRRAEFEVDGAAVAVDVVVRPLSREDGTLLVVFREVPPVQVRPLPSDGEDGALATLENELRATREHLQETVEALESSNEELQASNEELLSTNQELQSANEELQTSKEELQSVNEELETVNDELESKIAQLDELNADLENLLRSTDIATIFLDRRRRIVRYTPAARTLYRLAPSDVGRPLDDLAPRVLAPELPAHVERVLATLEPVHALVRSVDGDAWYRLGVHPYRTHDGAVDGAVLTFVDVTELEQARAREAFLAAIVESSDDAIFRKTLDGTILSWNDGAERMYGYAEDEIVGKTVEVLVPDDKLPELRGVFERLRRGERIGSLQTVRRRKDGTRLHVSLRVSPVHDSSGALVGASAAARDITAQVEANEALQRARDELELRVEQRTAALMRERALLQTILESAADGVIAIDRNGVPLVVNRTARTLLGVPLEGDLTGAESDIAVVQWPDGTPLAPEDEILALALRGETTTARRHRVVRKSGARWDVLASAAPVLVDGEIVGAVATFSDVTEMEAAREELRQARERLEAAVADRTAELADANEELRLGQERFRAVLEGSPVVVFNQDAELRYTWIHNAVLAAEDLLGRTDEEIWTLGGDVDRLVAMKRRVLETGEPGRDELMLGLDGDERWWDVIARPLRDAGGAVVGITGAAMDVTPRKRSERALRDSEERLAQAQKLEAVGRLAGGIAHDFNNLLTAMLGYAEVLDRRLTDETVRSYLGHIRDAAQRAAALTKQLLTFSRRQVATPQLIDLRELVLSTDPILRRLIGTDVELVTLAPEELWAVRVDAAQLEQVLLNLVVNARDAMPGGGKLVVELSNVAIGSGEHGPAAQRMGEWVRLAVTDTGDGMSSETMERCFEPFFTTKEPGKGTGLGLATVWGIVEQAGGFVLVDSLPKKGSRFEVHLPRALGTPELPAETLDEPAIRGGTETVLVVEDEPTVRELAGLTLGALGYDVVLAGDGPQALDLARRHPRPPDIVVSDIVMPLMNGREVVAQLRALYPGVAVLFVSGYADQPLGADVPFLAKPFTPPALARRVRDLLDARAAAGTTSNTGQSTEGGGD